MKSRTCAVVGFAVAALFTASASPAAVIVKSPARKLASTPGARPLSTAACVNTTLGCNNTFPAQLTTDDCFPRATNDQSYYDVWVFEAVAGSSVRITMMADFDTFLWLYDPDGVLVEANDDIDTGGGNLNSRIEYDIDKTGTWTVWANSYDERVTGPYTIDLFCSSLPPPPPTCTADSTSLCLNSSRFRVSVAWRVASQGTSGVGVAQTLTSDTGYFWFFTSNNIELVIKVVDGRAFNNHFWVFYGALSDVEYTITVTDTATGAVKTYSNPHGRIASVADAAAFPSGTPAAAAEAGRTRDFVPALVKAYAQEVASLVSSNESLVCVPSPAALCLNGSRFRVHVAWRVPTQGTSGFGTAQTLTSDTGYFWFFSANNVELVIKVVDGRAFNGFYWVFYGALSDVEYTITVTDTETGAEKIYSNPQGRLASVADVAAFR